MDKKYGLIKGQEDGRTRTKVYRVSASTGNSAGNWAINNYKGKNYSYGFGGKITSKNPTCCSKIVWQSYCFIGKATKPTSVMIIPYQLPSYINGAKGLE
ncbi:hypothetical protein [Paraliobacillus sp. JSM ZJ581]|uniref:hypothetical protein n=1 Tax=Paraliobacillus sp. JSM ZJ581 TaxID=3342118 RepID=UPI0035A8C110